MAAVTDTYPTLFRRRYGREITLAVVVVICTLLGLLMCTNASIRLKHVQRDLLADVRNNLVWQP